MQMKQIKELTMAARNEAKATAEKDYRCVQSRGIAFDISVNGNNSEKSVYLPTPYVRHADVEALKNTLQAMADTGDIQKGDKLEIRLTGGFNGADTVQQLKDDDYQSWVSEWSIKMDFDFELTFKTVAMVIETAASTIEKAAATIEVETVNSAVIDPNSKWLTTLRFKKPAGGTKHINRVRSYTAARAIYANHIIRQGQDISRKDANKIADLHFSTNNVIKLKTPATGTELAFKPFTSNKGN